MDKFRPTPGLVYDINTHNKHKTTMLQRGITNSHRHGVKLKVGTLNAAAGDCAFKARKAYVENRICFINKINESANECRMRCITKAQNEANMIPCIRKDIDMTKKLNKLRRPGITKLNFLK